MKKINLIVLSILTYFIAYSQQNCPTIGKIEAVKMNVLYIGAVNHIQYSITNTDPKTVKLFCEGCDSIKLQYDNMAKIWVSKPGSINIKIENKGINITNNFRVKYCPDPTIKLFNGQKSGVIKVDILKKQQGILPVLENFDFDIRCNVFNFKLSRHRNGELISNINVGNIFNNNNLSLIESAKKGDLFTITEIKGECTGDKIKRDWGGMVFCVE